MEFQKIVTIVLEHGILLQSLIIRPFGFLKLQWFVYEGVLYDWFNQPLSEIAHFLVIHAENSICC